MRLPRRPNIRRVAFVTAVVLTGWISFGITPSDEAAVRRFDESARAWQTNPEFPAVASAYCTEGSRALAARPLGLPAGGVVMALRSLPFLPKEFAVNEGSALHYRRFAKGPLCAYLHLCTEQDIPVFAKVLEEAAAGQPDPTLAARWFLDAFHMDEPVCTDAGAVQSAASLEREIDATRPLAVRENIGPLLLPHIRGLARDLGVPEDVDAMSAAQQRAVFERLDAYVHARDPELWRTKRLSDFCAGVWAQVFGPSYGYAITPVLLLHQFARIAFILLLLYWAGSRRRSARGTESGPAAVPV